ncbi:DUF3558 domain-containing protein [Parasphingorhabdus pacifica]
MNKVLRPWMVAVAGLALASVASCSSGGSADKGGGSGSPEPQGSALANLDPCSILTPQLATEMGLPAEGELDEQISSEPACLYDSGLEGGKLITINRNAEKTLEEYGAQDNWGVFKPIEVNGRSAAEAINEVAMGQDLCTTMLSAGGGVVLVDAQSTDPREPFDACGESLKIAEQIEPSLPE